MSRDRAYFILRRLHSLTGIIPIGAFLLTHLYINSGALLGECAFDDGVRRVNGLPYLPYIEIFGIFLPIGFHAALGLWMVLVQARYNPFAYNYARNWWFVIQRLTGVLLVGFLIFHIWDLWVAKELGRLGLGDFYAHLDRGMGTDTTYLAIMVLGCLAASFHLANGGWGFFASWGILQSRRAQRIGSWAFGLAGVALAVAWLNIVMHFATGGQALVPVQDLPSECVAAQQVALDD
jgi:succinate dehydrogenase / fumarate reductase cytochrome b subunit